LRHWWRIQGRHDDALIDAFAGATVKPGRYEIFWDGRNDQGMSVNKGNYLLNIEIAREHGEHEELSIPFLFDGSAFEISAQGKQELGQVSLQFNPD
jgi:FAD:protein FMN transferase